MAPEVCWNECILVFFVYEEMHWALSSSMKKCIWHSNILLKHLYLIFVFLACVLTSLTSIRRRKLKKLPSWVPRSPTVRLSLALPTSSPLSTTLSSMSPIFPARKPSSVSLVCGDCLYFGSLPSFFSVRKRTGHWVHRWRNASDIQNFWDTFLPFFRYSASDWVPHAFRWHEG